MAPETIRSISYGTAWTFAGALVAAGIWVGTLQFTQNAQANEIRAMRSDLAETQKERAADSKQLGVIANDVDWIKKALEKRGITP